MTRPVLVAYASKHGSTAEVAEVVAADLAARGITVEVNPAAEAEELTAYGGVVLGGALYMGRLHRDARGFLRHHREALAERPVAVFAMGPMTLDEKALADSRGQLDRALAAVPEVVPVSVAVFGGVVHSDDLRFPFSHMADSDARDWDAIHTWVGEMAPFLGGPRGVSVRSLPVGAA